MAAIIKQIGPITYAMGALADILAATPPAGTQALASDIPDCRAVYTPAGWSGFLGTMTAAQFAALPTMNLSSSYSWVNSSTSALVMNGVSLIGSSTANPGNIMARGVANAFSSVIAKLQTNFANYLAGNADMVLAFAGESTTAGAGAVTPVVAGMNDRYWSWPQVFGRILTRYGLNVSYLGIPPSYIVGASDADGRWIPGAGWATYFEGSAMGACYRHAGTGADVSTLQYRGLDGIPWDTANVWTQGSPGFTAAGTIYAGGGNPVAWNNNNSTRVPLKFTCKADKCSADNVLTIAPAADSKESWWYAAELFDSTKGRRITIANLGVPGCSVDNWTNGSGTGIFGYDMINALHPDCAFLNFGGNESTAGRDAATYLGQLQTLITALTNVQSIALVPTTPRSTDAAKALVDQYIAGHSSLVPPSGVPLTDLKQLWYAPTGWRDKEIPFVSVAPYAPHLPAASYKAIGEMLGAAILNY